MKLKALLTLTLSIALLGLGTVIAAAASKADKSFTDTFDVDKADLAPTGTNRFFILAPGYQLVLEGKDKGKAMQLTITVLNETRVVDGVETRVIEEKETADGQLVEISRNFFAISKKTTAVFYFGEEVDIYKNGKVVSHDGAWLSGVAGARFGLTMPGQALLGARYQHEVAPKVAMDRAEIISVSETLDTEAGKFERCLKTEETTPLESGKGYKVYAPGVGVIEDAEVKLVKFGMLKP